MTEHFISSKIKYIIDGNKIIRNNMTLKDEEGNAIDPILIRKYIHKEVSNFIYNHYDNIIALVGAGASVVTQNGEIDENFGKTVAKLADIINSKLKADSQYYSLQELANHCKYNIQVELKPNGSQSKLNPEFNLEDFLSNLLSCEKYISSKCKEKFAISKEKIFNLIISNTSYDYDNKYFKHSAFINTLSHLVKAPNKLTLVTTNYDTLLEDAADSIGYTIIDGFTFTHRPRFDSDMFDWNMVKDIENIKTKELEYKKNIINLLKLHGSLTWERDEEKIYRKIKDNVDNPIMIFPSSNKYMQSYQEPYFELFAKFQELLKRPNTLLITTGFSFADNHISQMIIQAILHNKSLATLITDFNINQDNNNWKKLKKLIDDNYQIAFLKASMNGDLVDYLGEYYDD